MVVVVVAFVPRFCAQHHPHFLFDDIFWVNLDQLFFFYCSILSLRQQCQSIEGKGDSDVISFVTYLCLLFSIHEKYLLLWWSYRRWCDIFLYLLIQFYMNNMTGLHLFSSWHNLLEHSHVHSQTPVFSKGCLLPHAGRTNVQWSQIWVSDSLGHFQSHLHHSCLHHLTSYSANCILYCHTT